GGHVGGGVAGDRLLERRTERLDLERRAVREQAHPRPPVGLAGDHALLVEPDQRGPDGRPTGAQQAGEVGLDEALVGLEAAPDDRLTKAPVDLEAGLDGAVAVGRPGGWEMSL